MICFCFGIQLVCNYLIYNMKFIENFKRWEQHRDAKIFAKWFQEQQNSTEVFRRFFFKNHLRNKSQKDGASTAKLKHLWGRDLFSATQQQVFYTLVYFVVPGTLSIWQTLQPCFDLWKKTGFLKRSKVAPFPDIPQNFLESCVLLQSSSYIVLALFLH